MEKTDVIKELHRIKALWSRITPISERLTQLAGSSASVKDRRAAEAKQTYRYNSGIAIANELPVHTAAAVENQIARRHRNDCLNAAKKKLRSTGVFLTVAAIIGMAITVFPHIQIFAAGNLEKYNFFSGFGKLGDFFLQLVFVRFTDKDGVLSNMDLVHGILAAFTVGLQLVMVLVARMAAASSLKAAACKKVPELGSGLTVLWIAASIIVGIFSAFTWITINPLSALGLLPIIILTPILKAGVSKLKDSRRPLPTLEESARLEEAKAKDAQSQAANDAARKAANDREKKKFETNQKKKLADFDKELANYDQEIDQLTDQMAALMKEVKSTVVADKDNNFNTVCRLLDYLENGRADTLKEALHFVDMQKERELDRENQRMIAQMKMQNDRFMADLDRQAAKQHSDQLLAEQRAHNERIQRKLDSHNEKVQREQWEHNREVMKELERIKNS